MFDDGPFALERLAEVAHVTSSGELVAVQFRFEEGYLSVEANPDDDTVDATFEPAHRPVLRHWEADSVRRDASDRYADVLGRDSARRWVLTSQQGYRDGFQIEFGAAAGVLTHQYQMEASHLRHRTVVAADSPGGIDPGN